MTDGRDEMTTDVLSGPGMTADAGKGTEKGEMTNDHAGKRAALRKTAASPFVAHLPMTAAEIVVVLDLVLGPGLVQTPVGAIARHQPDAANAAAPVALTALTGTSLEAV